MEHRFLRSLPKPACGRKSTQQMTKLVRKSAGRERKKFPICSLSEPGNRKCLPWPCARVKTRTLGRCLYQRLLKKFPLKFATGDSNPDAKFAAIGPRFTGANAQRRRPGACLPFLRPA